MPLEQIKRNCESKVAPNVTLSEIYESENKKRDDLFKDWFNHPVWSAPVQRSKSRDKELIKCLTDDVEQSCPNGEYFQNEQHKNMQKDRSRSPGPNGKKKRSQNYT